MVIVKQFMGGSYDTKDYPYILLKDNQVDGRASTIKMARKIRMLTSLNNPESIILLYNEKTKNFIDWTKKERIEYEKRKY